MSNPYKNLLSSSIIFTIANFGSKLITFFMVPLYTYVLKPEAYGTIDIVTTLSALLTPIVFLCISDAVMRYTIDSRFKKEDILSNALLIYLIGITIFFTASIIFKKYITVPTNIIFLFGMIASNGFQIIINQFLKAIGKTKEFAINGILYTLSLVSFNILFLVVFGFGIEGYFLSIILSNINCSVYAIYCSKLWKYFCFSYSHSLLITMLNYSIPLVPNALMWWVMDASDKFIITYFLGVNANGIYAISKKIPTIIDTVHSIFNQAWQLSAIKENNSDKSLNFVSNTYEVYTIVLFNVASILLVMSRIIVKYTISIEYYEAWLYIPFLLVSVVFSSLSGFLSAKFIAMEKTNLIFKTTIYGAIINTILNILSIPLIGINGAAISTAISFLVVLYIREKTLVAEHQLKIIFNRKWIGVILTLQIFIYYLDNARQSFIIMFILFICLLIYSIRTYVKIFNKIFKRRKNV